MRFLTLLLPAVALGAVVPRADDSASADVDTAVVPELSGAADSELSSTEQSPATADAGLVIAPASGRECKTCDKCVKLTWAHHSGCDADTNYTGTLDLSSCGSEISWVGLCGNNNPLLEDVCPTGHWEGGKCKYGPLTYTIGPVAAGTSVTINLHGGNVAGNSPGGDTACTPIDGKVGGNGCNNNYDKLTGAIVPGNTKCELTFSAGEMIPCPPVDPEPEPSECKTDTAWCGTSDEAGDKGHKFGKQWAFFTGSSGSQLTVYAGQKPTGGKVTYRASEDLKTTTFSFTFPAGLAFQNVDEPIKIHGNAAVGSASFPLASNGNPQVGLFACKWPAPAASVGSEKERTFDVICDGVYKYWGIHLDVEQC